jgi:uncharacterized protein DUF5995
MRIIAGMFPYDPALLAAVQSKPASIPEVLETMDMMEATLQDADGLKWFHWLYLQVTQAVEKRVVAGGFASLAWLAELDVQFAELYFSALRQALAGQRSPGCWRLLFDRRNHALVARIQFALAGINAHINHDLPMAIVNTCLATGTVPLHGSQEYQDYTATNTTLDSLIDRAKRELMCRLLGDPLPPISHLEDTLAAWNVSAAREAAWTNAEILWGLRGLPFMADRFEDGLDGLTAVAGKTLLTPVPLALAAVV